jgi:hypothetical protein
MVASLGLLGRYAGLKLPGDLAVLTNGWVIGIAIALYCVEFVADKIPWLDSVWDLVHTFIRIPAGAVVAAAALGDFNKSIQIIAFMLGGGLALSSHATKAATRATLNLSPEPVTNILASLLEDVIVLGVMLLVAFAPLLVLLLLLIFVVLAAWFFPKLVRLAGRSFRRAVGILKGNPVATG